MDALELSKAQTQQILEILFFKFLPKFTQKNCFKICVKILGGAETLKLNHFITLGVVVIKSLMKRIEMNQYNTVKLLDLYFYIVESILR